jgi:hypothetical protein
MDTVVEAVTGLKEKRIPEDTMAASAISGPH